MPLNEGQAIGTRSIFQYLSTESPHAAPDVLDRLESACFELGDRATLYPLVPWHEDTGFRRRVVGSYNIYYLVEEGVVEVIAILHSARDADRILFPED
ncbi:MAG TPA: type II toxin-antitoxin system RelE/ParE family toxin [Devosia sp.]